MNVTFIIVRAVNVVMVKPVLPSHVNVPVNGTVRKRVSNGDLQKQSKNFTQILRYNSYILVYNFLMTFQTKP